MAPAVSPWGGWCELSNAVGVNSAMLLSNGLKGRWQESSSQSFQQCGWLEIKTVMEHVTVPLDYFRGTFPLLASLHDSALSPCLFFHSQRGRCCALPHALCFLTQSASLLPLICPSWAPCRAAGSASPRGEWEVSSSLFWFVLGRPEPPSKALALLWPPSK